MRSAILILALLVAGPAAAQPPVQLAPPPAPSVTIRREVLETIMAEAEVALEQRRLLLECQADVARLAAAPDDEDSRLWLGVKIGGVTALVVGAFAAGLWIGH